jgi:hypothetical protein
MFLQIQQFLLWADTLLSGTSGMAAPGSRVKEAANWVDKNPYFK